MPTYEYTNEAGEHRDVFGSIKSPPPEEILIFPDGSWQPAGDLIQGTYDDPETGQAGVSRAEYVRSLPPDARVWKRTYSQVGVGVLVPNYVPKPSTEGLPISHASPRRKGGKPVKVGDRVVMEHPDGTFTNRRGQPILDSNHAARDNAKRTGMDLD